MRTWLMAILIVLSILAGCNPPHYDLREPIYLVPEESFWQGCEDDPDGYMACHAERQYIVYAGIYQWFRHFDWDTRPVAIIIFPEENVPDDAVNEVIKLRIGGDTNCKGGWAACYDWSIGQHPRITFRDPKYEDVPKMAHEFGHAIGSLGHVEGRLSIMTSPIAFYVTADDVAEMCAANGTCPPHDEVWCEGSFYDVCRCPSFSPEDGATKLASGEIVCI